MTFWESFWLVVEVFFFFAYLVVLFQIVGDLFRDRGTGGLAKAVWVVLLILFPFLGAVLYLIVRGRGMTERSVVAVEQQKAAADDYIRTVAGTSPAQEIAAAQQLLSTGAITQAEFADLKARALAAR
ncbi:MAG TPA: PLD nuclease N-terminal domain-containing protein [Cellulomonas sp.]